MSLPAKPISLCVAVACWLVCASGSLRAGGEAAAETKAAGGLRIRLQLSAAKEGKKVPPQGQVILENVGENDLNVNLGSSLANGKSHHPTALRLLVLGKGDTTRTLRYSIRVAGRLDPFIVPLPAGSTYTLRIRFDKFTDSRTGEPADLTEKDCRIAVELIGEAVSKPNLDLRGLALMPYWQEKVRSNELKLPSAKKNG